MKKCHQYFEWHDNNVLCLYCRQLLEQYLGIPANHPAEFEEKYHARVYVDSDMQQIAQFLQASIMGEIARWECNMAKLGQTHNEFSTCGFRQFFQVHQIESKIYHHTRD